MKLKPMALGVAGGILWGVSLMVLTWVAMQTGYAENLLNTISVVYPGYSVTLSGSFIGLVLGFVDAFVGLYILALLYNWIAGKRADKKETKE
jgi:uncharacterized membrane protein (DUF485 family)